KLNNFFLEESDYKEVKIIETCDDKSQIVGGPFGSNLKVKDYVDIGVPILRLQNIGKGYFINKSIKYITQNKAEELKYHSFKKGDIVLAKLGIPIGKTCIVPESFEYGIVVADVVRIRPNINLVNYSFLKNFLNSDSAVSQLSSEIRGSTRPRVNISEVRNLKLRLPPIDIQIEINHKIEKLNDLRTEQVNNYNIKLGSLLELKKSILDKAFKGELTSAA
ncbi:restriction endonuclease subunit S, partial [Flavobacteriaceae bacterium]|nr:restriction endonuclease subunit S [Flavobacteriaceae bacterium]